MTAYNILFLLGMVSSAVAAWALAREFTRDAGASLLAGLVYAFLPWRLDQSPHVQFQWGAFLPLILLFLWRYLEGGRRRDLALYGVCFAWNALANVHYGIFGGLLVALVLGWEGVTGREGSSPRLWRALAVTGLAAAAAGPFLIPYAEARRLHGMARTYEEMAFYSGQWMYFLSSGPRNYLYGSATARFAGPEGAFFPGVVPVLLAAAAILRSPREREVVRRAEASPSRRAVLRRWAPVLDVATLGLLLAAAAAHPGRRVGPIGLGDAGRLIVLATLTLLARLAIALPWRSRFRNLGDLARDLPIDRRVTLLCLIACVGILCALGANTPYYAFVFKSLSFPFRAIRAPARAIVLFHVSLATLSAWGLSRAAGRGRGPRRALVLAAGLIVTGLEYRASPMKVFPVDGATPPVYRWLAATPVPGSVIEMPLGSLFDFEYEFRSTAHWKALVNGSSGFAPLAYREIETLLGEAPIPDSVWQRIAAVRANVLIFHPHDAPRRTLQAYAKLIRDAADGGRLEVLKAFPHGVVMDYAFRIASAPALDAGVSARDRQDAAASFRHLVIHPGIDPQPPIGHLDFPPANYEVRPGEWAYGWALDDSGVLEVRVATERGPAGSAAYGGAREDVGRLFPGYPDAAHGAFGFPIPDLPPGPHTLIVTIVARDEGTTVFERPIRVR